MQFRVSPVLQSLFGKLLLMLGAFGACELALRAIGYHPYGSPRYGQIGGGYAPDSELGWVNAQQVSTYEVPIMNAGGLSSEEGRSTTEVEYTIWSDGSRATRPDEQHPTRAQVTRRIVFVGDSFFQASGITNHDTFAWKLQARFPDADVRNFGTGGYGATQSLLRMKRDLQQPIAGRCVYIYGVNPFHEERNIAAPRYAWLIARNSTLKSASLPWASIDDNGVLQFNPPEVFEPLFPFERNLSLMTFAEEVYQQFRDRARSRTQRAVTEALLREMHRVAMDRGCRFALFWLRMEPQKKGEYQAFASSAGIDSIDGSHPEQNEQSWKLVGDEHPNAQMNQYWTEQLVPYLEEQVGR